MRILFLSLILAAFSLTGAEIKKDSFTVVLDPKFKPADARSVSQTGILPGNQKTFRMPDTMVYDLRTIYKKANVDEDQAIIRFVIDSPKDCDRYIGMSADYWCTCYVNGKLAGTTEPQGEEGNGVDAYRRHWKISLKKGKNYAAIHTRPGMGGWKIACRLLPDTQYWPELQSEKEALFRMYFPGTERVIGPEATHVTQTGAFVSFFKGNRDVYSLHYWQKGKEKTKKVLTTPAVYGRLPLKRLSRFELNGLKPDTEYCYEFRSIYSPEQIAAAGEFKTLPEKGIDHTFTAISDTQIFYYELREALVKKMVQKGIFKDTDLLVSLGDVDDVFPDFERSYFESFLIPFRKAGIKAPFYPVRGNHEYRGTETNRYFDWFGSPYYCFRYGEVFYFVLDTGEDQPSRKQRRYTLRTDTETYFREQAEWVKKMVQTEACRTAKYRIVLAHATPFEWENRYYGKNIALFANSFYGKNPECRIDLWICGDTHSPYRFDPVTKERTGAKRRFSKKKTGILTANDLKNIHFPVYVNDGPRGAGQNFSATRVTIRKDGLYLTCIGEDGTVMDQIVIRKGKPFEVRQTTYETYIPYTGK